MTKVPARLSVARALLATCFFVVSASGGLATQGVRQLSPEAAAHLSEIISVMQRQWLFRGTMDWAAFERRVFERAGEARTVADTYDAIRLGLSMLGDKHSYYVPSAGAPVFNPQSPTQSTGECTPSDPPPES